MNQSENSKCIKSENQLTWASIQVSLDVFKPWLDDPTTYDVAKMCMIAAELAGRGSPFQTATACPHTADKLRKLSEVSKIPFAVISTFADTVAVLQNLDFQGFLALSHSREAQNHE
ncbi:hypothetical protein [Paraburkholderia elongata]|uniref:Uncharacterized protein n=1 Tax=Paraburkholderia elongata TaxID=2675747 RepID=A0A972NXP1_9BURK|nr:hypothetical protein [Paraburkholderia elongata]NPT60489.1 hypothetical protein [Paraburkholderia elongata]